MYDRSSRDNSSIELADIFLRYAQGYIKQHGVSAPQNKAIKAISHCRTAVLGGHVARCNHCGVEEISYNSCRYRHCPKCQTTKQLRWLESRKAELLPVNYFHVVFTIPHELNGIASYNPSLIYNLLFKSAWSTINTLGQDKERLGGLMGMLALLHTWGQNLSQHIHLHCMIPGGALCDINDQKEWRDCKNDFLFPVKVMSTLFGKTFLTLLQQAYKEDEISFKGAIIKLADQKSFEELIAKLTLKSWNVYAKTPFNGSVGGIEYLARYVSKIALSNERLISHDNQEVTFKWRDYSDNNQLKHMTLNANEFIRRYLTHVLPDGFMRIRTFGFLANAVKAKNSQLILSLLKHSEKKVTAPVEGISVVDTASIECIPLLKSNEAIRETDSLPFSSVPTQQESISSQGMTEKEVFEKQHEKESIVELIKRITGIEIDRCKYCKIGQLKIVKSILSIKQSPAYRDTS